MLKDYKETLEQSDGEYIEFADKFLKQSKEVNNYVNRINNLPHIDKPEPLKVEKEWKQDGPKIQQRLDQMGI